MGHTVPCTLSGAACAFCFDVLGQVRAAFVALVGWWMCKLDERQEHESRLLPYLLAALTDDCPSIAAAAWTMLDHVGAVWEQDHAAEVQVRARGSCAGMTMQDAGRLPSVAYC